MFAPGDLSDLPSSPSKPVRFYEDRLIGALILLSFLILCLVLALGMDNAVFVPYNATHAPTLTARAKITGTPTERTPRPRSTQAVTPHPLNPDQEVRAEIPGQLCFPIGNCGYN